jgi:hypothetical protein
MGLNLTHNMLVRLCCLCVVIGFETGRTFAHGVLDDANKQDLEARITGILEPHYPAAPEKRIGKETNRYLK